MNIRDRFSSSVFFGLCLLLAACGGGSGGSASDDNGGDPGIDNPPPLDLGPVPSYSGSNEPARIDRSNALDLARTAMSAAAIVPLLDSLWVPYPEDVEDSEETVQGGSGSATIELSDGTLTMTFDSFTEDGLTISGIITETANANAPTWLDGRHHSHIDGTLEFDRVRVSGQGVDVSLHGTVTGDGYNHLTFNLLMEDKVAGESGKMEDFVVEWKDILDEYGHLEWQETYLFGRLYDSGLGWVDVSTAVPLHEFEFASGNDLPRSEGRGTVNIVGGGTGMQLQILNRRYAALALDENADSEFDAGVRITWNQLLDLEPFSQGEGTGAPIANPGIDFTTLIGDRTFIHGFFSHHEDNLFLTYHWRLLAVPPGAQAGLPDESRASHLEFVPQVPGDYLLELEVSDGQMSSRSTQKIHVSDDSDRSPFLLSDRAMRGQVEVSASADKSEYTFDAGSWLKEDDENWSFELWGVPTDEYNYVLDSNTGAEQRVLYNPDGVSGMVRVLSAFVNIGYERYERYTETEIEACESQRTVSTVEFGSGHNADILQHCVSYGSQSDSFYLLLSRRDGTLKPLRFSSEGAAVPSGDEHLTVGDIDGDGWHDVVTVGTRYQVAADKEGLYVSRQVEDPSSGERHLAQPQLHPFHLGNCSRGDDIVAVAIEDFDGDSQMDILALEHCASSFSASPANLTVWHGTGGGEFAAPQLLELPEFDLRTADFADFDDDGRVDLVFAGCFGGGCNTGDYDPEVWVFLNREEGFVESKLFDDPGAYYVGLVAGDFTGDEKTDLIYSSRQREGAVLFHQDTQGGFIQGEQLPGFYPVRGAFAQADLNGDGALDLLAPSEGASYDAPVLALNKGAGTYELISLEAGQGFARDQPRISTGDMDGDGMPDIVFDAGDETYGFTTFFAGLHPYATGGEN